MPKMIGKRIAGAIRIDNNATEEATGLVRLAYRQAIKLPVESIICSLDTTDRGGRHSYAKRWYRWFASPSAILNCENSTAAMKARAIKAAR